MTPSLNQLSGALRTIYNQDRSNAAEKIEIYLNDTLEGLTVEEKLAEVQRLAGQLNKASQLKTLMKEQDDKLRSFASLLLGETIAEDEADRDQLQLRLHDSLTSIFNGINQLLLAINQTMSQDGMMDETIRQVVRGQLGGQQGKQSLEDHIDQIRTAFMTSYEAFKAAHKATIDDVLGELAPDKMTSKSSRNRGVKFGPLRRADAYDEFVRTYNNLKSWHESGRGMEEYLRFVEKHCSEASHKTKEV